MCLKRLTKGCCDDPWWFDNLSHIPLARGTSPGKLVRKCGILPKSTTTIDLDSAIANNWYITANYPLYYMHMGFTADGVTAWAAMEYDANNWKLNVFDIPSRTLLFADNIDPITAGSYIGIKPGVDGQFAVRVDNGLFFNARVYELDGTFNTYFFNETVSVGDGGFETIEKYALVDWPNCASTATRSFNRPSNQQATNAYAKFYIGEVNPSTWAATNKTLIREITYPASPRINALGGWANPTTANFIAFDHFDGQYVACLYYDTSAKENGTFNYNKRAEIIIDGTTVVSVDNPTFGANWFSLPDTAHVCYPHQTLGGGYVAVAHQDTGVAAFHHRIHVYKNGSLVWKTNNPAGSSVGVIGSTDRWIYFSSNGSVSQVTNGEFSLESSTPTTVTPYFMARHDGSQIIPCNSYLGSTYGKFGLVGHSFNTWTTNCFLRRSSVVTNSAPATYDEMWAKRNDL